MRSHHLLAIALGMAFCTHVPSVPLSIDNGVPNVHKPKTGNARIRRQAKAARKARNKR